MKCVPSKNLPWNGLQSHPFDALNLWNCLNKNSNTQNGRNNAYKILWHWPKYNWVLINVQMSYFGILPRLNRKFCRRTTYFIRKETTKDNNNIHTIQKISICINLICEQRWYISECALQTNQTWFKNSITRAKRLSWTKKNIFSINLLYKNIQFLDLKRLTVMHTCKNIQIIWNPSNSVRSKKQNFYKIISVSFE